MLSFYSNSFLHTENLKGCITFPYVHANKICDLYTFFIFVLQFESQHEKKLYSWVSCDVIKFSGGKFLRKFSVLYKFLYVFALVLSSKYLQLQCIIQLRLTSTHIHCKMA